MGSVPESDPDLQHEEVQPWESSLILVAMAL
jgi:hypothetical protein